MKRRPENGMTYLYFPLALFSDIFAAILTFGFVTTPMQSYLPNLHPLILPIILAIVIVSAELALGASKNNKTLRKLGMLAILVVPIFTLAEAYSHIQNNFISAELGIIEDLQYENMSIVLVYVGKAFFSYVTHLLMLKNAQTILFIYGISSLGGVTEADLKKFQEERKERSLFDELQLEKQKKESEAILA